MYGHSMHRVYDDWLDLMLHSLQRDDEKYLETLEDYGEEEAHLFTAPCRQLHTAISDPNPSLLFLFFEVLGPGSPHFL